MKYCIVVGSVNKDKVLVHTTFKGGTDSVPKRRYINFRRRGINKKKYNIQQKAKV